MYRTPLVVLQVVQWCAGCTEPRWWFCRWRLYAQQSEVLYLLHECVHPAQQEYTGKQSSGTPPPVPPLVYYPYLEERVANSSQRVYRETVLPVYGAGTPPPVPPLVYYPYLEERVARVGVLVVHQRGQPSLVVLQCSTTKSCPYLEERVARVGALVVQNPVGGFLP